MGVLHGFFAVVCVVFDVFSGGRVVGVGDEAGVHMQDLMQES